MENIQSKKEKIMQLVMVYTPWITVICVVAFIGIATADWVAGGVMLVIKQQITLT